MKRRPFPLEMGISKCRIGSADENRASHQIRGLCSDKDGIQKTHHRFRVSVRPSVIGQRQTCGRLLPMSRLVGGVGLNLLARTPQPPMPQR